MSISLLIALTWIFPLQSAAQCEVEIIPQQILGCQGDTVELTALGGCKYLLIESFNDSILNSKIQLNHTALIGQPCGPGNDGTDYLWFGTQNTGPHSLTTSTITGLHPIGFEFDFRYGEDGTGGNCDGPATLAEAVHLQCSVNGGPWTDIHVFDPNGGHDSTLVHWKHYFFSTCGISSPVRIRWIQNAATNINTANWGVDNITFSYPGASHFAWSSGQSGVGHTTDVILSNSGPLWVVSTCDGVSCSDTINLSVTPKPTASFTYTGKDCKYEPITFNYTGNAPPSATYNWSFTGPNTVSGGGQGPVIVKWSNTGAFFAKLSVSNNGCVSDPAEQKIRISPFISFYIDNTEGCEPLTINFKGNAYPKNSSYYWEFGDGGTSTDSTPTYTYQDDGNFTLSLMLVTPNGCSDTMIFPNFIHCFPKPEIDFSYSPDYIPISDPTANFDNKTMYGSSYLWDFGDGGSSNATNPSHTYGGLGDYLVWLYAQSDKGCRDSLSKVLKVVEDRFKTPNVITPNGDGLNDYFVVENLEYLLECRIEVYNRWGERVYSNEHYDNKWAAEDLPDGVYFYVVKYTSYFGEGEFRGSLTIIR